MLTFPKFAASALKAGDRPLTRDLSVLEVTLLDRGCGLSGTLDLPLYTGTLLLGF